MENSKTSVDSTQALPRIIIGNEKISFSFYNVNGSLKCGKIGSRSSVESFTPTQQGLNFCRELEIVLTQEGRGFAARSRSLGGSGDLFIYQGHKEIEDGTFVFEHWREDVRLRAYSFYQFIAGLPIVRRWVTVHNEGNQPVAIEALSSLAYYHLADPETSEIKLHIPFSSWSGENQWQTLTKSQAGLTALDASHYRASCLGSRSAAEYAPMAMFENCTDNTIFFWQIEHSASWMWEVGHLFVGAQHGYYLVAGGPDEKHGHWWKLLKPGETFETIPVAIGATEGNFEKAIGILTRYRRLACRSPHPVDDGLPVIFNDYMHCLWGDPTLEKELPLIEDAAEAGCEVFCMDSGWYAAPGEHWWPGVGEWLPNKERFPGNEFSDIFSAIRQKGMIPGIWIEAESVGINSAAARNPDSWFLHRHGQRVQYNRRNFWNLKNPDVIVHLDSVIDRLVENHGIGYIKNDYNIDLLQGVEDDADSLGDGLLEQTRALYSWIESIHRRHPSLIWENCAAGGLRCDYGILSRAQLQSSSDQQDCQAYAAQVGANTTAILPEQSAVWSYPQETDSDEAVVMNMVNVLLCRVHLSGPFAKISVRARELVRQGIEVYKEHRLFISQAEPLYPLGLPTAADRNDFLAFGLHCGNRTLLAIWKFSQQPDAILLPWHSLHRSHKELQASIRYPIDQSFETTLTPKTEGLFIGFGKEPGARLICLENRH